MVVFALSFAACDIFEKEELITMDEFDEIEDGMSYEEVCDIVGSEGELSSESTVADYTCSMYSWEGKGSVGANAIITFSNGKVSGKSQSGLK